MKERESNGLGGEKRERTRAEFEDRKWMKVVEAVPDLQLLAWVGKKSGLEGQDVEG